tara:strand:- start:1402 stop:1515 length:114 start_codon:yes stop_codon:yes gene_type:complete
MKIIIKERCKSCNKNISKGRYYCFDCFEALERKGEEE